MAWSLAGAALLLALGQGIATAATITVTTNNPAAIADGQCSLIEAITNANNHSATYPDCAPGTGTDTIIMPANANVLLSSVDNNTYLGPTGLPKITSHITIEGNGATIARQSNAPFRLMAVANTGELTLENITLSGGDTEGGGGVFNFGTLSIKKSTISGNTADRGGGVFNWYGKLTVENTTISGNTAHDGGGVFNSAGSLTISNSTISGNIADAGGGLFNTYFDYGFGPSPATLTLSSSLIAGNQATGASQIENVGSIVNANKFNLFGTNGDTGVCGFTPGPTDIVPAPGVEVADILGPLADNGGPTPTHALLAASPAVNAGDPNGCRDNQGTLLLTDQRGFPRPSAGTICDIGSYELQAAASPSNSAKVAVNVALPADTVSLNEACPPAPPPPPPPPSPLTIAATTLAMGEAGVSFTSDLMISGGVAPYMVSITKGTLPAGLSLGNDGIVSGTLSPTAKSAKITVRITDSVNESITQTFTITVVKALSVSGKIRTGRLGKNYNASFRVQGGRGPFNWSITSGALPMGLSFNTATGAITGIPTESGMFPLTVQVTDALGGVAAVNQTLKIN
jgi:hypothetical protein